MSILINRETNYDTIMKMHLCPVAPLSKGIGSMPPSCTPSPAYLDITEVCDCGETTNRHMCKNFLAFIQTNLDSDLRPGQT